jgi:hypothetical protein
LVTSFTCAYLTTQVVATPHGTKGKKKHLRKALNLSAEYLKRLTLFSSGHDEV